MKIKDEYINVQELKPNPYNSDGTRKWVWAAWANGINKSIKVFADKIGTASCTAEYWKEL